MSRSGRWESKREAQATMFLTMGLFRPIVDFTPSGLETSPTCVNIKPSTQTNKKEITMTYDRACEILNFATPKSFAQNARLATECEKHLTLGSPLRLKVACKVLIEAANQK